MRHYFGFDSKGRIASTELHAGGFPDETDLLDAENKHPILEYIRTLRSAKNPEVVGFVAFDCGCSSSPQLCGCPREAYFSKRIVDGKLVDRITPTFLLDGKPVILSANTKATPIVVAPNTKIVLQILGDLTDAEGTGIDVYTTGQSRLMPVAKQTLTVAEGKVPSITLITPGQGITSGLSILGERVVLTNIYLLSFAS